MSLVLRGYQQQIISEARQLMARGNRSMVICSPTGSGKTALTVAMLTTAASKGLTCWFLVHRRELIKQSVRAFSDAGTSIGVIASQFVNDPSKLIQVASVQTLANKLNSTRKPDLIVWDECFVLNTMVSGVPIQDIKIGHDVDCFDPSSDQVTKRKVLHIFKNTAPDRLYKIKTLESEVICTSSHPFYIGNNMWVSASDLRTGDKVYGLYRLRRSEGQRSKEMPDVLQGNYGREKQKGFADKDERKEPDEVQVCQAEGQKHTKEYRTPAKGSGRQWEAATCSPKNAVKIFGKWLDFGVMYTYEYLSRIRPINSLQNRYCEREIDDRYRSGWRFSWISSKAEPGQEENHVLKESRVVSVEVYKSTDTQRFKSVCPDGYVYNLEVEGLNTYFANGVAVHNCHHNGAKTWQRIYDHHKSAYHIGLTATPIRTDGQGLGKYFEKLIQGPSVSDLICQGHLAPYRAFAPSRPPTQTLHIRGGDFMREESAALMNRPTITGSAIAEYKRHAFNKRNVVFCVSIEHSRQVVADFNAAGIPAAHVDGETPHFHRDNLIEQFRSGRTKVLSNVDLFGEGFDLPAIECVTLLRPTMSLGLYLQMVGRGLRPYPGKECAVILDHAANIERHGLPDEQRDWTLGGLPPPSKGAQSTSVKVCPRCFAAQPSGKPFCMTCKEPFAPKPREVDQTTGELKEIDKDAIKRRRTLNRIEQGTAQTEDDLVKLAKARGYKNPLAWARHVFNSRQVKKLIKGQI